MKKRIVAVSVLLLVMYSAKFLLGGDEVDYFYQWAFMLFALGLMCMPTCYVLFSKFHDRGYLFSKVIGIVMTGYCYWFLSSLKLLEFTRVNCVISVGIILVFQMIILLIIRKKEKVSFSEWIKSEWIDSSIKEEFLFISLLLVWCYIKGFKPEAYGTEKFMDFGFMTSMMREKFMPPYDFWYAGEKINYYYFGQYLAVYLTKLSNIPVGYTYNLMLMTIAAFSSALPYSIGYNLCKNKLRQRGLKGKLICSSVGVFSGMLVTCSSNMQMPLYKWVVPSIRKFLLIEGELEDYWFSKATRYIGYLPKTNDQTIHEFPAYSIVVGDLHAHYINMIFVLTVLALLLAYMLAKKRDYVAAKVLEPVVDNISDEIEENVQNNVQDNTQDDTQNNIQNSEQENVQNNASIRKNKIKYLIKEALTPQVIAITCFIGVFHMSNYWDFPIYFVVSGSVILFKNLIDYKLNLKSILITAIQGICVLVGGIMVALPFTLNFDQISTEVAFVHSHTPLYQFMVLWALPIITVVGFIVICVRKYKEGLEVSADSIDVENSSNVEHRVEHLKAFFLTIDLMDLFVILLGLCSIGLVLMPEIIYVKDIYVGSYYRANTMFKLTYQAFIMFCLCTSYIVFVHLKFGKRKRHGVIIGFLSLLCCYYIVIASNSWFKDITNIDNRKTLDASSFVETSFHSDENAINYLNDHVKGKATIIEAQGKSYSEYQRISVATGLQTVLGWTTHAKLWHNNFPEVNKRIEDIETFYSTNDLNELHRVIDRYNIEYIYVGDIEHGDFMIQEDLLKSLGEVVFSEKSAKYKKDNFIVKVDRSW